MHLYCTGGVYDLSIYTINTYATFKLFANFTSLGVSVNLFRNAVFPTFSYIVKGFQFFTTLNMYTSK